MTPFTFAHSALHLPIPAFRFLKKGASTSREILVLGGVHGDEPEGVAAAWGLLESLFEGCDFSFNLTVIPQFNMDGVLSKSRLNGNGVDLNRNLPTQDWNPQAFNERYPPGPHAGSEPENKALISALQNLKPVFILSLHSWKPMLNTNGDCDAQAQAIHAMTGYSIEPSIGYPTPGSLGTYAGIERSHPTLTYEIERGLPLGEVVRIHVPAIIKGLEATP